MDTLTQEKARISAGNSKLGNIPNISLTPVKACGNCSACASKCYALKAYRQYPATKAAWDHNLKLAFRDRDAFFLSVHEYLSSRPVKRFRWHVSGDILDQDYLDRMSALARIHEGTRFLAFTKMHNLDYSQAPENLEIVFSMFPGMPEPTASWFPIIRKAWYQDGTETRIPANAKKCPGSCENCKACFTLSKQGRDVWFKAH
jgi:hypothetical protein